MEYDFSKPPSGFEIATWGKNQKPHLFICQPGISVALALFQSKKMADYFEKLCTDGVRFMKKE